MKTVITSPFNTISASPHSHRGAPAFIYADMLEELYGSPVEVHTKKGYYDYSSVDEVYVYHGNDWQGSLNLFGGMKDFGNIEHVISYSQIKGKVYSLAIEHPKYSDMLLARKKGDYNPLWDQVDWENLKRIENTAKVVTKFIEHPNYVVGDSHAISLYRRGWEVNSIPFKTLHGALSIGLSNLIPNYKLDNIEFYFGNIDVRHHLCRHDNQVTIDLVKKYYDQVKSIADRLGCRTYIYELLPIENESRVLPKTGYYKGKPFYGSWSERNAKRLLFKEVLTDLCVDDSVRLVEWVDRLTNDAGELDFSHMEKPKSVHLSRASYPHWQGITNQPKTGTLDSFFS